VSTLKLVVGQYSDELHVWNDLGVKSLLAGLQEEARNEFTEVSIQLLFFSVLMLFFCFFLSLTTLCLMYLNDFICLMIYVKC